MKTIARFLRLQSRLGRIAIFIIGPLYFMALKAMGYRVRSLKKLRQEFARQIKKHEGPWIICANHLTMIDSFLLAYAAISLYNHIRHYQVVPWNLPEQDNFQRSILMTVFCYLGKCIPVNRGGDRGEMKKMLDKCAYILGEKQNLMIFPEGTRSRTGRVDTENFSYGVGRFIKDIAGCKVMCIYLRGDHQDTYGIIPKFGERFTAAISVFEPQRTELTGLRAQKYYAKQVIKKLARMEEDYFTVLRVKKKEDEMGKNGRNGKGNSKYPGRPSMCEKAPGDGACLKQLKSSRPRICINCNALETLATRIKVFGR